MNEGLDRNAGFTTTVDSLQDLYSSILEYYDELFPLDEGACDFFLGLKEELRSQNKLPVAPLYRYLGIGCATGALEIKLSGTGFDITGIDRNPDMIATAKRRLHSSFSTTRFFEMSTTEMARYLKKNSFHVIACLDNTLPYIADLTLLRKFFHDAKTLLTQDGKLIIHCLNADGLAESKPVRLPERSSIRVRLSQAYIPADNGEMTFQTSLELGNGKTISLKKGIPIQILSTTKIMDLAREAGFTRITVWGDYRKGNFTSSSENAVIMCS